MYTFHTSKKNPKQHQNTIKVALITELKKKITEKCCLKTTYIKIKVHYFLVKQITSLTKKFKKNQTFISTF